MGDTGSLVTEGSAKIILPDGVFYNKVQEFNRDITVAIIKQYELINRLELFLKFKKSKQKKDNYYTYNGLTILEALSATGIRSVRFAHEIPNIRRIIANDLDPNAVAVIGESVQKNNVQDFVYVECSDAINLMQQYSKFENR